MSKRLHQKILELRNKVGYKPTYEFMPNRKKYDAVKSEVRNISAPSDENPRLIKQYFCIWGVPDDYGTRPIRGCFKKSIEERGPNTSATNKIIVLDQHRQYMPACLPTILKEDEIGLYGEYEPDPIPRCDDLIIQIRRGTINNGSYGFGYVWDKMGYNEKDDCIDMFECELHEVSPVTFGSQGQTFVVRSKQSLEESLFLEKETEALIKKIPRNLQLEIRSLISRHISLASITQPVEQSQKSLRSKSKPKQQKVDLSLVTELLEI